ncbi:hypothetical protein ACLKA6_005859 [Drosophila palustris]
MKFILILACLTLFVVLTQGQRSCRGRVPSNEQNCLGGRDRGSGRRRQCRRNANNEMWYYNQETQSCRRMSYRGCGGNKNRYCSLEACERKCRRTEPEVVTPSTVTVEAATNSN